MIFLLDYDRQSGRLIDIVAFENSQRSEASKARLELEIRLFNTGISREVVLLEAESEGDLRKTHNRYFGDIGDLARSIKTSVKLGERGDVSPQSEKK